MWGCNDMGNLKVTNKTNKKKLPKFQICLQQKVLQQFFYFHYFIAFFFFCNFFM